MTTLSTIVVAVTLQALLQTTSSAGSFPKQKVQIHVPHTIQHHHHTHTKYHFITLARNGTSSTTTTQRPVLIMPIMPGVMMNATVPGAQNPQPAGQPNFPQTIPLPQQPNPAQAPMQPDVFQQQQPNQPNALQPQQPMQPQPAVIPQQPNPNFQTFPAFLQYTAANRNGDYDYIDTVGRSSRNKIVRADPPIAMTPMKFKTIINVHETKKIPLSEILDFTNLIKRDPPRRIKVDVFPEKKSHMKPTKRVMEELQLLQENLKTGNFKNYEEDDLEYNPDTAAFQSKQETVSEKPEWITVKRLLEKHIQEDFPGLKIHAELKHVAPNHAPHINPIIKERADGSSSAANSTNIPADLKHIGYIVIGENNEQYFVGLDENGSPT